MTGDASMALAAHPRTVAETEEEERRVAAINEQLTIYSARGEGSVGPSSAGR